MVTYANYQYSLTADQQSTIQLFLRSLPADMQKTETWTLLHQLTYATDWSEQPKFRLPKQAPFLF
jgi:hypothetical protein